MNLFIRNTAKQLQNHKNIFGFGVSKLRQNLFITLKFSFDIVFCSEEKNHLKINEYLFIYLISWMLTI